MKVSFYIEGTGKSRTDIRFYVGLDVEASEREIEKAEKLVYKTAKSFTDDYAERHFSFYEKMTGKNSRRKFKIYTYETVVRNELFVGALAKFDAYLEDSVLFDMIKDDWSYLQSGHLASEKSSSVNEERIASKIAQDISAGRSYAVTYVLEVYSVFNRRQTDQAWRKEYGRSTSANIKKFVTKFNEELYEGGVNEHLGLTAAIYGGRIIDQRDGDVVADWEDRNIKREFSFVVG